MSALLLALACAGQVAAEDPAAKAPSAPPEERAPAPPAETPMPPAAAPETVALEGIVTAWKQGAMRDHGDDGSFAVYDAAEVRLTSPPEHAGKVLTLYAQQPVAADLLWKEQGALVCFDLRASDLAPRRQIFVAAAKNARKC